MIGHIGENESNRPKKRIRIGNAAKAGEYGLAWQAVKKSAIARKLTSSKKIIKAVKGL